MRLPWLVAITTLSFVNFSSTSAILDATTCNRIVNGTRSIDDNKFELRCFMPASCAGSDLSVDVEADRINRCPAIVGIRYSPDGRDWKMVMQLRGTDTDVDRRYGIRFENLATSSISAIQMKCNVNDKGKAVFHKYGNDSRLVTEEIHTSQTDSLLLCEAVLRFRVHKTITQTLRSFDYSYEKAGVEHVTADMSPLPPMETKTTNCSIPRIDRGILTFENSERKILYMPASTSGNKLQCSVPGEEIPNLDKFELKMFDPKDGQHIPAEIECQQSGAGFSYKYRTPRSIQFESAPTPLVAVCIASACSMCPPPSCTANATNCPTYSFGSYGCARLSCPHDSYWVRGMDGDEFIAKGAPDCMKIDSLKNVMEIKGYLKNEPHLARWTVNGKPAQFVTCAPGN